MITFDRNAHINNTDDFRVGKRLINLSKLREIGFAANRRLLEVERLSHDCILAEDRFQHINNPVSANGQRASGLRFADPRVHPLWHAIILFRLLADGFRAADLRPYLTAFAGRSPDAVRPGAVSYQRRRLRLHGMIKRIARSHRYRVTDAGFRAALFFIRLYNRLLRPGLAASCDHHLAATPLGQAFHTLDIRIASLLADGRFAPQT